MKRFFIQIPLASLLLVLFMHNITFDEMKSNADKWFEKGESSHKTGNYIDAIAAYGKSIELNPKTANVYYNRGVAHHALGNYRQAIKDYNMLIKLNPQFALAYYHRADAYYNIGNHNQAAKDYEKAIELNPNIERPVDDVTKSIRSLDKAVRANPKNASAYFNRGIIYYDIGSDDLAIKDLRIAARLGHKEARDFLTNQKVAR